ncbi:cell division protein FtsQ/DivIB [Thiomicrospira microaerophila]|uniref:cell division protein FtsQ/DivIB n=1 Tax=Thiomicrospira microaerophila TaxID=406020 RepID=UPI0006974EE1|nr:FtsQ-type POTRA domain-containing protein [Thiomicrospira microaerophila]
MFTKLSWLLGFALAVSLIFYGYLQAKSTTPEVLSYSIENPLQHVSLDEVDDALYPFLVQGFWKVDLLRLQTALEQVAWIHRVEVQRSWPSNLKIKIQEYQPIARWGESSLVTADAVVFTPIDLAGFEQLIQLDGDLLQVEGILQLLDQLPEQLEPLGWSLVDLRQHIDGVLSVELDNGLVLRVDQANWSTKVRRFVRAYPLLAEKLVESAQGYDLRNTNGFAIIMPKNSDLVTN